MATETVGDLLLRRLREWGVDRIYGYPGDGINGILGSLNRAGNDPELLHVRHEEMAAFMACAHAKFTGEMGVCMATGGPGAVHLLNGLRDGTTRGRHLIEARVRPTLEVVVTESPEHLRRRTDPQTGLALIDVGDR